MGEILQRRTFVKGEVVFKEGEEGNHAYVIQDGEVEIIKEIDGQTVVLGVIGKGGMFGEMALIDSQPRMAMARCKKGSTIIVVTRAMFEQKLKSADPFVRGLLNIMVSHVRRANK